MQSKFTILYPALLVTDLVCLNTSIILMHFFLGQFQFTEQPNLLIILIFDLSWIISSLINPGLRKMLAVQIKPTLKDFLKTILCHLLIVGGFMFFSRINEPSRREIAYGNILFISLYLFVRLVVYGYLYYHHHNGQAKKLLIIGCERNALKIVKFISVNPRYGYDLVDFISDGKLKPDEFAGFFQRIMKYKPATIFICISKNNEFLLELIRFTAGQKIEIEVLPEVIIENDFSDKLLNYKNITIVDINSAIVLSFENKIAKRLFDIVFSGMVLIFGAPIYLALIVLTWISSRGPVFYKQPRVGKNGSTFEIYKFRTMKLDAELSGPQLAKSNDPRVTKWGKHLRKTRLDELPQFWNVIKGDMSIVGPRPERQHYLNQILERNPTYRKLLQIKPGITSIGQIAYGYAENVDQMLERLEFDLCYLNKISINADLNIIFQTLKVVIQAKGQ